MGFFNMIVQSPTGKKVLRAVEIVLLAMFSLGFLVWMMPRHRLVMVDRAVSSKNETIFHIDLDHDGRTEKIQYTHILQGGEMCGIIGYNGEEKIIDQWNFKGTGKAGGRLSIGDVDGNGKEDLVIFSRYRDSLYVSCLDVLSRRMLVKELPLLEVFKTGKEYDFTISSSLFYDADGDGWKELYFTVMSGFAKRPRGMFRYDFRKGEMIRSPLGCALLDRVMMADLDQDGTSEIFNGRAMATSNCKEGDFLTDHCSWILIFRPDLTFKFPPLRCATGPSETLAIPLRGWGKASLLVFSHDRSARGNGSFLELVDRQGQIMKRKKVPDIGTDQQFLLFWGFGKRGWAELLNERGQVWRIDSALGFREGRSLPPFAELRESQFLDLDRDGKAEFVYLRQSGDEVLVLSSDGREVVRARLPVLSRHPYFSVRNRAGLLPQLTLDDDLYHYHFLYGPTLPRQFWYLFFFGFLMLFWLTFRVADKIREYRQLKISDTQRKIYELQLRSFQNQLDPHFTFNAIASLGTLIYTENKEAAYDYLVKFSGLIRKILESSDKISRTLQEELEFVRNYLDLQKYRFRDAFEYKEEIAPGVNLSTRVPRMVIETHVENALKHGLMHSSRKGEIRIRIREEKGTLLIEVEDNGIGREEAWKINRNSTHMGMRVTEQFYTLINKYNRHKISREVIDLYDEGGRPAGTRVVIRIPHGIRYVI